MKPLIELEDVAFGYGSSPVLTGIDLHLHPGQFAALVGPSGGGKSTIINLLLRFWDPSSGDILLAGRSPADYSLDKLRNFVGVLSQRTDLFTGTIREGYQWKHHVRRELAGNDLTVSRVDRGGGKSHQHFPGSRFTGKGSASRARCDSGRLGRMPMVECV